MKFIYISILDFHSEAHEVTTDASKDKCEDEDKKNSSKCTGCSIMCIFLVVISFSINIFEILYL